VMRPVMVVGATVAGEHWVPIAAALSDVFADAGRISWLAIGLLLVGAILWLARRAALRRQVVRPGPTWACGYPHPTPRMQYTASSFAAPLASVFGRLAGVREHRGATVFHSTPVDLVLDAAVLPLWARVERAALRLRPMQQGRLHVYLIYVVVTVVLVLGYLVLAPTRERPRRCSPP